MVDFYDGSVELPPGASLVGRASECRLRFARSDVSRRHVRFVVEHGVVVLEDLDSTNGTRVNGIPLHAARVLSNGDVVELGDIELRVRIEERADALEPEELDTERTQRMRAMPVPDDWASRPTAPITSVPAPDSLAAAVRGFERRIYTRHHVALHVRYESETLTFDGEARDLSIGGMFIATDLLDAPGTLCSVTLLTADGPHTLTAVVAHVVAESDGQSGLGVRFSETDVAVRDWLVQTLASRINVAAPH